jgi:hypothetical protein
MSHNLKFPQQQKRGRQQGSRKGSVFTQQPARCSLCALSAQHAHETPSCRGMNTQDDRRTPARGSPSPLAPPPPPNPSPPPDPAASVASAQAFPVRARRSFRAAAHAYHTLYIRVGGTKTGSATGETGSSSARHHLALRGAARLDAAAAPRAVLLDQDLRCVRREMVGRGGGGLHMVGRCCSP